jgi:sugar phosphate permease
MGGTFVGTFLVGWFIGKWANDNRGPTYGLISSLGSVALILFIILPAGGNLGLMVAIMALAGGLNGGLASLKRRTPPRG